MKRKLQLLEMMGFFILVLANISTIQAQSLSGPKSNWEPLYIIYTKDKATVGCNLSGPDSVIAGNIYQYLLQDCKAAYWEVAGGSIQAQDSSSLRVSWGSQDSLGSIRAFSSLGAIIVELPVSIKPTPSPGSDQTQYTLPENPDDPKNPGGGSGGGTSRSCGSISNTSQTIAYNTRPQTIMASPQCGYTCSPGTYLAYQWECSNSYNGVYTDILGATSKDYSPENLTESTYFRRKLYCCTPYQPPTANSDDAQSDSNPYDCNYLCTTSNTAFVCVSSPPPPPYHGGCINSADQSICSTQTPTTITTSAAIGCTNNGIYNYQWQSSSDGTYFFNIPGATSQNLSFSAPLPKTTWFQRKVTCNGETKYTLTVKIKVATCTSTFHENRFSSTNQLVLVIFRNLAYLSAGILSYTSYLDSFKNILIAIKNNMIARHSKMNEILC